MNKQIPFDVLRILIPDDSVVADEFDSHSLYEGEYLDAARDQLADELSQVADEAGPIEDPLLAAIHHTRQTLIGAKTDRRMLLAYGREFAPRGYSTTVLAMVAGMSASNIRIGKAYKENDIATVARLLRRPRSGVPDNPEIAAMSHIDSLAPEQRHTIIENAELPNYPELSNAARERILTWARSKYTFQERHEDDGGGQTPGTDRRKGAADDRAGSH